MGCCDVPVRFKVNNCTVPIWFAQGQIISLISSDKGCLNKVTNLEMLKKLKS